MYLSFHRSLALRSNCCFQHVYKLFRFKVRSCMIVHQYGVSSTQVFPRNRVIVDIVFLQNVLNEASTHSCICGDLSNEKVRHCEGLEYFLIILRVRPSHAVDRHFQAGLFALVLSLQGGNRIEIIDLKESMN